MPLTRLQTCLMVLSYLLAIAAGGVSALIYLSCYMTSTGLIDGESVRTAVTLSAIATTVILLAGFLLRNNPDYSKGLWIFLLLIANAPTLLLLCESARQH